MFSSRFGRRRFTPGIVAFLTTFLLLGFVSPANASVTTGSISGKISGAAGVNAYQAVVYVYPADSPYSPFGVFPEGDGAYTFNNLTAGAYKIQFASGASNGLTQWYGGGTSFDTAKAITVTAGKTVSGINALLAKGASLDGNITLPAGMDSRDIQVKLYGAASETELDSNGGMTGDGTDVHGFYKTGLPAGSYKLLIAGGNSGAQDQWYGGGSTFQSAKTVTLTAGQALTGIDATLVRGATISGTVSLAARPDLPGSDVSQVSVSAYDATRAAPGNRDPAIRSADVRPDGTYTLVGLQTGSYKLEFGSHNYEFHGIDQWYSGKDRFATAASVSAVTGEDTPGINIVMAQMATISGKITMPSGADPTKVSVYLHGTDPSNSNSDWATPSADGTYAFKGVRAGTYVVGFSDSADHILFQYWGGSYTPDKATVITVGASQSVAGISPTLIKAGAVRGKITAAPGMNLQGTLNVYKDDAAQTWQGRTVTNADGTYDFPYLAAGRYKLEFRVGGYASYWYKAGTTFANATPVSVLDGKDTTGLDFYLPAPKPATPIGDKVKSLNGALGAATTGEIYGLKNGGGYQCFRQGCVVWSPATGAHVSRGGIRSVYGSAGFENGKLGYPTSDEIGGIKNGGAYQLYQGGAIYWSPATGAHLSVGGIRSAWAATGFENGKLGYPTSEEIGGLKNGGVYQLYQSGAIYWSPATGAHMSTGAIRSMWAATRFQNGRLGYPTSDEYVTSPGNYAQNYQGGVIKWGSRGTGITYK